MHLADTQVDFVALEAEDFCPRGPTRRQHRWLAETTTRGISVEEGGYIPRGELRLWDNEDLMGWYVANEGAVRSKGTQYFVLHRHGINASGRWVGLYYDGRTQTGSGR